MALDRLALIMSLINKSNGGGSADLSNYYTKSQTNSRIMAKIAEIVANAPEDFDTLKEISDWIENHEDSAAAMNSAIAANTAAITDKVDKVSGKGLSANDFTNTAKTKLDGLENYDDSEVKSQTALNRSTLGYQRKNLLLNKCVSKTMNGVTATVNSDGSITLSGSNTLGSAFVFYRNLQTGLDNQYTDNRKWIPNGEYIVSGSAVGADIQVRMSTDNTSEGTGIASKNGAETGFTVTDDDKYVWARILITSTADFSAPVTIYPMIRYPEITDDTYEPYKPSVAEYMENNITTLDSEEEFDALTAKTAAFYFIKETEE